MLGRKHIQIEDWQAEYLEHVANKCGVDVSKMIRADLCMVTIMIAVQHGYVASIIEPGRMFSNPILKHGQLDQKKLKRFMEDICAEGRTAAEYMIRKG